MLRRTRTTKKLAKRIDLQYFANPHPFRRWRFWLSVAVPVIALGWFVTQRAQGGQKVYSSGQLSHAHAVFTQQCTFCHVAQAGAFTTRVTDKACLACHDAPTHHANQAFTPTCTTCHVEHKGAMRLQETADAACTQCHAKLGYARWSTALRYHHHQLRKQPSGICGSAHGQGRSGRSQAQPSRSLATEPDGTEQHASAADLQ